MRQRIAREPVAHCLVISPLEAGGVHDRFVMLLTDSASIRDVILFPQLRREE